MRVEADGLEDVRTISRANGSVCIADLRKNGHEHKKYLKFIQNYTVDSIVGGN